MESRRALIQFVARSAALAALIMACALQLWAETSSMLGDWREPEGSIIRVERCDTGVCLALVSLSPTVPGTKDVHNPDRAQRGRQLCGIVMGGQFRMTDENHALGGWLYDPKSGNTYHGAITAEGNTLKLRGYIGLSVFGRTETWQRVPTMVAACNDTGKR